jgi:hypothetical protein
MNDRRLDPPGIDPIASNFRRISSFIILVVDQVGIQDYHPHPLGTATCDVFPLCSSHRFSVDGVSPGAIVVLGRLGRS